MKTSIICALAISILSCIISSFHSQAQNVGINTSGTLPNASSGLDIDFSDKGVLFPQISLASTTDAVSIVSPATSLMIYNTNSSLPQGVGYYYNSGTPVSPVWVKLITRGQLELLGSTTISSPSTSISWTGSIDGTNYSKITIVFETLKETTGATDLNFRVNNSFSTSQFYTGYKDIDGVITSQSQLVVGQTSLNIADNLLAITSSEVVYGEIEIYPRTIGRKYFEAKSWAAWEGSMRSEVRNSLINSGENTSTYTQFDFFYSDGTNFAANSNMYIYGIRK